MSTKVAVVGAGAWGTALAAHVARLDHDVCLWAREPEVVVDINQRNENSFFLDGVTLPKRVYASVDPAEVLRGATVILMVVPSAFLGNIAAQMAAVASKGARVVIASKGIDEMSLGLMTEVVARAMPDRDARENCVLSGPSFAREVAIGLPTDVVVASHSAEAATDVAAVLHSPTFRVYTSKDPVGVSVGGAMKNVVAIAAGACDALSLGTNARASLVTRGLSEIARLGVALGGDPMTFLGLSGVGDLILTSTGALSRNRTLGMKIAEGVEPASYVALQRTVAEGYVTARAAWRLAQRLGVDLPITEQVYHVLHEGRPLLEAMRMLLTRAQKNELWGLQHASDAMPDH